jgi:hypothetical protein
MKFRNRCLALGIVGTLLLPLGVSAEITQQPAKKQEISPAAVNIITPKKVNPVVLEVQRGEIVDQAIGDVDGDGNDEEVLLMGNSVVSGSHFMGNLYVVIKDRKNGQVKGYIRPIDCGGYDSFLTLADVTGNGVANVLITSLTGGSGGIVDYRILDFSEGKAEEIFTKENNSGIACLGKYLQQYKAELTFPTSGKTIVLDLPGEQDMYRHLNVYDDDGQVINSGLRPYIQDLSSLVALDVDNDGTSELVTSQRVVGATNFDTLGYVRTIWKYMAGSWQVKKTNFYTDLYSPHIYKQEADIIGAGGYLITKQCIEINGSSIKYPHFSKMGEGLQQWQVNRQIDACVKKIMTEAGVGGIIELNYEVKYAGKKYTSVLFTGSVTASNRTNPIMQAFNFNMNTGESIELENLVGKSSKFWGIVTKESTKQGHPLNKKDVQGYYYDGGALVLLHGGREELALAKSTVLPYLKQNKIEETF